jgi:hypothetical protein
MVREKLAEAEQAAWERSQVNVIDPVPSESTRGCGR